MNLKGASPILIEVFQRIEQRCKHLQKVVVAQAPSNSYRVQAMYSQFQNVLKDIYVKGEGWIEEDVDRILKAVEFGANKHQGQFRKDEAQTSYLAHPLSVAFHLLTVGKVRDPDIIIAGLLHDTLEDTATHYQELVDSFGERVAFFVHEVSDDKTLAKDERKRLQMVNAPKKSAGAAQIKLADKWDNLTDLLKNPLPNWSEERTQAYFEWARKVVEALPWVNAPLLNAVEEIIKRQQK